MHTLHLLTCRLTSPAIECSILTGSIDCVWLHQAWYFDRDDVALKGFHKYFKNKSEEEREHAEKMMKYQNSRGGRIVLQPIDVR